jgi:hypothetical protein
MHCYTKIPRTFLCFLILSFLGCYGYSAIFCSGHREFACSRQFASRFLIRFGLGPLCHVRFSAYSLPKPSSFWPSLGTRSVTISVTEHVLPCGVSFMLPLSRTLFNHDDMAHRRTFFSEFGVPLTKLTKLSDVFLVLRDAIRSEQCVPDPM